MEFEEWLEQVCQRPLPRNPMARVHTYVKELAEGSILQFWPVRLIAIEDGFRDTDVEKYLDRRLNDGMLSVTLVESMGYIHHISNSAVYQLTQKAFALLDEAEPANIFISYKRSESSAFALLVLARLKDGGLEPFIDMAIEPGEQWHAHLEERIRSSDYFIVLLGPETLNSEITRREIEWALDAGLYILPVWHNGFVYESDKWRGVVSPEVDAALNGTHTIRVLEESASAYNTAIVELLNRFGVTP